MRLGLGLSLSPGRPAAQSNLVFQDNFDYADNTALNASWTPGNSGILTLDTGRMKIANGIASQGRGAKLVPVTIGDVLEVTIVNPSGSPRAFGFRVGTSENGTQYYTNTVAIGATGSSGAFETTSSNLYVTVSTGSNTLDVFVLVDNLIISRT